MKKCACVGDYGEHSSVYKTAYTDACKTHYTIAVYTTVNM